MSSSATTQRRRTLSVLGALALTLSTLTAPAFAEPDLPADGAGLSEAQLEAQAEPVNGLPGVDEISRSRNMVRLANLPKQAPFDNSASTYTDLAFQDNYAFVGNYNGFVVYDIRNPRKPKIASQVLCPGSQNDISVYGNLLFLSTDSSRSDNSCNSVSQPATTRRRGKASRSSTSATSVPPSTSRPSRPTVVRTLTRWCRARTRRTCTSTSRPTRPTPRSRTASRRTTRSRS